MATSKTQTTALDCLDEDERTAVLGLAEALRSIDKLARREGWLDIGLPIAASETAEALCRIIVSRARQIDPYFAPCLAMELGILDLIPNLSRVPAQEVGDDGSIFVELNKPEL